jgi:hypothetical protein
MNDPDDLYTLDVTINLELPGGWVIASLALAALTNVLTRLEHDGIHPNHTTIEINETTTR